MRGKSDAALLLTGQYTPQALNNIMENPTTDRSEAAKKAIEAAGGKLISFYATPAEGPDQLKDGGPKDEVAKNPFSRNPVNEMVRRLISTSMWVIVLAGSRRIIDMQIRSVGIDLGKATFHLVALSAAGNL